ncbi:MAG: hypothetical protein M3M96_01005 [Candidatus Eremiobacteraeota bacterium]|nr:hypothetical protein [Candidatus Eremiobacteraeota bacterium]
MFVPFSRIVTVAMFAVLCFALVVPMALKRGNMVIAVGITLVFVAYFIANVVLWQRMKPRR